MQGIVKNVLYEAIIFHQKHIFYFRFVLVVRDIFSSTMPHSKEIKISVRVSMAFFPLRFIGKKDCFIWPVFFVCFFLSLQHFLVSQFNQIYRWVCSKSTQIISNKQIQDFKATKHKILYRKGIFVKIVDTISAKTAADKFIPQNSGI